MSVAIMQPYIFPYVGYYQLVNAVDNFIFFDDVNYINKGYINRNSILVNQSPYRFTLPIISASQNKRINELCFDVNLKKLLDTLKQNYNKSMYFEEVFWLVEKVLTSTDRNVSEVTSNSIKTVFEYLGIEKKFNKSSVIKSNVEGNAADRLISICKSLGDFEYINSIGGMELYDKDYFLAQGVTLNFIKMRSFEYKQNSKQFVPNLSIIDLLMNNDKETVSEIFGEYDLL